MAEEIEALADDEIERVYDLCEQFMAARNRLLVVESDCRTYRDGGAFNARARKKMPGAKQAIRAALASLRAATVEECIRAVRNDKVQGASPSWNGALDTAVETLEFLIAPPAAEAREGSDG